MSNKLRRSIYNSCNIKIKARNSLAQYGYTKQNQLSTALTTILPILFQYCYTYCYSDSRNLWAVMKAGGLAL